MKKVLLVFTVINCFAISINAQAPTKAKPSKETASKAPATNAKVDMKSLNDSFSYAAGVSIANNMKEQGITSLNMNLLMKAFNDVLGNKPVLLTPEQSNMCVQKKLQEYAEKKSAAQKQQGQEFLAKNKSRKEVVTLPDGLQYEILKAGETEGVKPTAQDTVVVDYVGTLIDGKEFDNSIKRGQPAEFPVGGVIKGWTEILQLMTKGAHWKVYIPSELGYGDRGAGGSIPPGATLVFEITLRDIKPVVKK